MKTIRGGMGLGDALYVQSVVRHLVQRGERLQVRTKWPEVFSQLGEAVQTAPFTRQGIDLLAHYSLRKGRVESTQFEDCCIQAGVMEPVEFKLDWTVQDEAIVAPLRAHWRPILCVQLARTPMDRTDGFGKELLPDCRVIQQMIDRLRERFLVVQVGSGRPLHHFQGIDIDMANRTTVTQLLDVATLADAFLGYCSFIVPLAESFARPALLCWSARGLRSRTEYVRRITPHKVLHRKTSQWVVDDWNYERIAEAADGFLR